MLAGLSAMALPGVVLGERPFTETADLADLSAAEEYALYPVPAPQPGEARAIRFALSARAEHQFSTGLDGAGDFSASRLTAGLGFALPIGEQFSLAIGSSLGLTAYDFDRDSAFGGSRPWDTIYTGAFTAVGNYRLDETWTVFGGGILGLAGEDGASVGDSATGGGLVGVGYRHSDQLAFRLGLSAISQIEDDVALMPVILVDWRIDEQWRLLVGSLDVGAADAIGVGLSCRISEEWSLGGRLAWVHNRFRLDGSGFAPDGVGQDDRLKATLVINWRPSDDIELGLLGGLVFSGSMRVEDEDGNRLFKADYDPAGFVGARLAWRF